jgi:ABC-type transport system involved in multi-copper enzyme maturation permease subunit
MFRALLWKEWRELWMLPVAAAPVAAISFLMVKASGQFHEKAVWDVAFGLWISAAAIYIPAHLYARKADSGAASFLSSHAIDRFRLWWLKLAAGASVFALVSGILYIMTVLFRRLYPGLVGFELLQENILSEYALFAVFVFCYTSLISTFFKRLLTALAGAFLLFFSVSLALAVIDLLFRISLPSNFPWLLCPAMLLASLAVFARGNLWKQTRGCLALGYGISIAITVLATAAIDPAPFSAGLRKLASFSPVNYYRNTMLLISRMSYPVPNQDRRAWRPGKAEIVEVFDISPDGKLILLDMYPEWRLVMVNIDDLTMETVQRDEGFIKYGRMNSTGTSFAYSTGMGSLFLSNIQGTHKKKLLMTKASPHSGSLNFMWSLDGNLLAVTRSFLEDPPQVALVNFYDSGGELLGQYLPSPLREAAVWPIGWDSESRFYFSMAETKRGEPHRGYWRIRPTEKMPEPVPYLDEYGCSESGVSSDGKWIVCVAYGQEYKSVLRRFDVTGGAEFRLPAEEHECHWAHDGKRLAYIEDSGMEAADRKLKLLEPDTGETISIPLDLLEPSCKVHSWSTSDRCLLLTSGWPVAEPYFFFVASQEFRKIERIWSHDLDLNVLYWIPEDNLAYFADSDNVFTISIDDSGWKEIFRFTGEKFIRPGEEQS